jgi:FkbM family methyltransferase
MSEFKQDWINQFIGQKEKLVIFDIGSFNFEDSVRLKNYFKNANVYAFEAFDYNCEKYGDYAKRIGVTVHNLAISDKKGETTFYNSTDFNGREWTCSGSILEPSEKEGHEIHEGLRYNISGITVETTTINDFCIENDIENIDILHMDIQGAEYYAIKGMGDKIRPKIIFCETCEYESYKNSLSLEDLDNLLFSLGYEIRERLKYDTLYILK